ncbi:MAG TPA: chromosome segregation protein SMC [Candidatus Limnocylindria bacterium]|nr:chromosome segregation protein SMC [Candidatus Limnocylindria bacterium]
MSRLRELRLHGFKTFAEPTRFVFEPGVNAVIGPNGSGKSNMADAVRWVLGEQSNRSLRTRRADDVIFAGSQQRKPTGMAEVTLTLDNADGWLPIDFAEVTIGRRAYRSGETEYLVNGARARLRDVVELLAGGQLGPSSLVVVGQGTVDAALSLRPEERRQLFEEAAGVKSLQVRKNESLARLARAEENLTRVADLLGELRPQVRRLALQAQHQQEHDAMGRRGRALVAEVHRRRERELRDRLGDARRNAAAADSAAEASRAVLASGREALTAAEARYWAAEEAARRAGEAREATRETLIRLEARAEALAARAAELTSARDSALEERAGLDRDLATTNAGGSDPALDAALADAAAAEGRWRLSLEALASADAGLVAAEEALARARRHDAELVAAEAARREAIVEARARSRRLETELEAVAAEANRLAAALEPLGERASAASATRAAARAELAAASAEVEPAQAQALEARRRATGLAERVAGAQAQHDALSEHAETRGRLGARLAASGWRTLVDSVPAPADAWAAIEAVVGGELGDALLWRDADPTRAATDARGTARLLDGRRPPERAERDAALRAVNGGRTLAEWIGADDAPGIFERVAVAPDVAALLGGWRALPPGWCAVTADGDLADGRGLVALRGRADPPGGEAARQLARRRELAATLEELEREHDAAADRAAEAVARAAAAQRRLSDAHRALDEADAAGRQATAEAETARLALGRAESDRERITRELSQLSTDAAMAEEPDRAVGHESIADHAALAERAAAARAAAARAGEERDLARGAWQSARGRADELESGMTGARQRRAELEARRSQLEIVAGAAATRLEELETARATLAGELVAARDADARSLQRRAEAEQERERERGELLRLEREGSGAGSRLADLDRSAQAAALEVVRLEEALGTLTRERELALESFAEVAGHGDQGIGTLALAPEPEMAAEVAALDDEALEAEQRRVRRMLAQIGSVNPFAVEEHREQSARLEEVSAQERDLTAAIGSTRELIATLDREIEERFGAAFTAISARFDEFVQVLFAGGSASLERIDGQEGEEPGGIEIVVRPPGKRPQRLAMLSGGERALTGVALLFAMLSVNPVPFCILDEVDAALDEANIGRFAQALRRLAEQIDFVVITHNRATIEVADTIYGVTMTDAAVSRVISLRLADVPVEVTA